MLTPVNHINVIENRGVNDGLPVFRVKTCRRKDTGAPDCERGVQLAPGLASLGGGGKEGRGGDVDGRRAG